MAAFLDHIVLSTWDVERLVHFYTAILALPPERLEPYRRGEVPFPSVRLNDETVIDLFPREEEPSPDPPGTTPNLHHFCLALDKKDWDDLKHRLENRDIAIHEGPVSRWGARGQGISIYFNDPDGNEIEARYYPEN